MLGQLKREGPPFCLDLLAFLCSLSKCLSLVFPEELSQARALLGTSPSVLATPTQSCLISTPRVQHRAWHRHSAGTMPTTGRMRLQDWRGC